eukprot:Nk52_evm61s32 gene=Nk52_evmTU61s32
MNKIPQIHQLIFVLVFVISIVFHTDGHVVPVSEVKTSNGGQSLWKGKLRIVNNVPRDPACKYESDTINLSIPKGPSGTQIPMPYDSTKEVGPFTSSYYTLGVQENVYMECSYFDGNCHDDGGKVDQPCFNFSVFSDCSIKQNDCPYPAAVPPHPKSAAPNGNTRYTISGSVDPKDANMCVLTVNPHVTKPVTPGCKNKL